MFLQFFSLSHNPFRTRASGADVFVGPQQAAVMSGLQNALVERDAVAVVMGPVGAGKSVAVSRALDTFPTRLESVRIGRMHLGRDELLEELINGLGGDGTLGSAPRRAAELKRLLNEREDQEIKVAIVVEDAVRLGVDGLVELESLTSADSGDCAGANLILMGPPDLHDLLAAPELARLKQRICGRQAVSEFSVNETRGYIAARLRTAGGSADALFTADAVEALQTQSGGIARVINRLGSAALRAAADEQQKRIDAATVLQVAGADSQPTESAATEATADEPPGEDSQTGVEEHAEAVAPQPATDADTAAAADADLPPAEEAHLPPPTEAAAKDPIPDLIQDTMPEFPALKLPEGGKTTTDLVAELRDKTDNTEPSLPVLTPDGDETEEVAQPLAAEDAGEVPQSADTDGVFAEPMTADPIAAELVVQDLEPALLAPEDDALPAQAADDAATAPAEPPKLSEAQPPLAETASAEQEHAPEPADIRIDAAADEPSPRDLGPATEPVSPPRLDPAPATVSAQPTADDAKVPSLRVVDAIARADQLQTPRPPKPLSRREQSADTQTVKALDDALRPDTALFQALDAPAPKDASAETPPTDSGSGSPERDAAPQPPKLSAELRLSETPETPDVAAAANPPIEAEPDAPSTPLELALADEVAPQAAAPAAEADSGELATPVPEITLEASIREQQDGVRATLEAEALEREAAAKIEAEKNQSSPAELAAAAEREAEKQRLAGMSSISEQFDANAELPEDENANGGANDERVKLEELAAQLGGATSLEEVDEVAAETLFGVEFSQLANTVTMAAPGVVDGADADPRELEMKLEADAMPTPAAASGSGPTTPEPAVQETAAPPPPKPAAKPAPDAQTRPPIAEPGSLPDIDSSAARRLEMVRSLNGSKGPAVPPATATEEIVLGDADPVPPPDGPSPDRIEDQFGTSMTANLKALSMQNVQEMEAAEEQQQQEEKKRGFLSRFRRS